MEKLLKNIKLKEKNNPLYWDFKHRSTKYTLSRMMKYPATMVSDMQSELIDLICAETNVRNVLDPFCGSGTTLVESYKKGLNITGIDINPLSYLLVNVKFNSYSFNQLRKELNSIISSYSSFNDFELMNFPYIDKWFRKDIIINLSKLRELIKKVKHIKYRQFYWIIFADLIRDVCNSRNSTSKLYIKTNDDIENINNDIISLFERKAKKAILDLESFKMEYYNKNIDVKLYCDNTLSKLSDSRSFKEDSIDLICTSPPYGDNLTTISYGQFSILQLNWIDINDLSGNIKKILMSMTKLDKLSMGGKIYTQNFIEESDILNKSPTLMKTYTQLINNQRLDLARKVASFIYEYDLYMQQAARVIRPNGYHVLTLGNRNVNGEVLRFDTITLELSSNYGFKLIWSESRNIQNKRGPKNSRGKKQVIDQETIIILTNKS